MSIRGIIQGLAYYVFPLVFLALSLANVDLDFFYFLGDVSIYLLFFTLLLKPFSIFFRARIWKQLLGYRRELGILIFWMVLFHGVTLWFRAGFASSEFFSTPHLLYGLIAGFGIFVLGITSNKISTRTLKKHWKPVHAIAYPTLIFAVLHAAATTGEYVKFTLLSLVYFSLRIAAFAYQKNTRGNRDRKSEPSYENP